MKELIVPGILWAVLIGFLIGRPAYIRLRSRLSPKYAAARQVRLEQRRAGNEAARRRAREDEAARLKNWATENADDPTAQAYLATLPADTMPATTNGADEDIKSELRKRQQADDDTQERLRQRRLKEAAYLKWALEHSDDEVAQRYLGEALVEADRNSVYGPNQAEAAKTAADIREALGHPSTHA